MGEAGLKTPIGVMCGCGLDLDSPRLFPFSLFFSSSVFLPSLQNGRLDDFPLPAAGSSADTAVSVLSRLVEEDWEGSFSCGNDPGSSGARDPLDSVSLACVAASL
jgi:hypothetical protein